MDHAFLSGLSSVVLELHRDGRDVAAESFCGWALDRVRRVVRFDSAMWGHGHADPVAIHDVHLDRQPASMMTNYARHQRNDFFAAACNRSPGRTVNLYDVIDRASFVRRPIYRHHAKHYGMEHILCTVIPEPESGLVSFVSLWRADHDDPYTETDRLAKQFLMPHLVEARRLNVIDHLCRATGNEPPHQSAAAICDVRAILHECEPAFVEALRTGWSDWRGPTLPDPLARAIVRRPSGTLEVGSHRFEWAPFEQRRLLRVRTHHPADSLSAREREVAMLVAEGCTHKEVAARLGVSPNTARTHIYLLYKRLGVSNKAQMIRALGTIAGYRAAAPSARRLEPLTPGPCPPRP